MNIERITHGFINKAAVASLLGTERAFDKV
jgi:hypothetical protein